MSLENDASKSIYEEVQAEKVLLDAPAVEEETVKKGLNIDFGFLFAKTGDGGIEDYVDHPLNFSKSKGIAQMLRGATGMFFELDLAIIDIVLGSFQLAKEGKVNANITG